MKIIPFTALVAVALSAVAVSGTDAITDLGDARLSTERKEFLKNRLGLNRVKAIHVVRGDHPVKHVIQDKGHVAANPKTEEEDPEEEGDEEEEEEDSRHVFIVHKKQTRLRHEPAIKSVMDVTTGPAPAATSSSGSWYEDVDASDASDSSEATEYDGSDASTSYEAAVGSSSSDSYEETVGSSSSDVYEEAVGSSSSDSYEEAVGSSSVASYEDAIGSSSTYEDADVDGSSSGALESIDFGSSSSRTAESLQQGEEGDLFTPEPGVSEQDYGELPGTTPTGTIPSQGETLRTGTALMSTLSADTSPFGVEGSQTLVLVASVAGIAAGVLGVLIAVVGLRRQPEDDEFGPNELESSLPEPQSGREQLTADVAVTSSAVTEEESKEEEAEGELEGTFMNNVVV